MLELGVLEGRSAKQMAIPMEEKEGSWYDLNNKDNATIR
jgi:hypothetical protein